MKQSPGSSAGCCGCLCGVWRLQGIGLWMRLRVLVSLRTRSPGRLALWGCSYGSSALWLVFEIQRSHGRLPAAFRLRFLPGNFSLCGLSPCGLRVRERFSRTSWFFALSAFPPKLRINSIFCLVVVKYLFLSSYSLVRSQVVLEQSQHLSP